ncbi:MAG: hypothetical protein IJS12_06770 [Lachnospiraceae bacterium]|nr:hypothetical protein [Lachnospiraceae bacterium]
MNEKTIAVCDLDPNYALNLSGALDQALYGHFNISTFTSSSALCEYLAAHDVDTAIISESAYDSDLLQALPVTLILLRENPDFVEERAILINRFQSREELMESVLKVLPENVHNSSEMRLRTSRWKVIGIYSPIRRCLQTSFSLALGQMLGAEHKTLYMNFENYSGFSGWFNMEFKNNITDLLYYFDCEREKLTLRISLLVHRIGDLDILPPAGSCYETYDRNGQRWVELMKEMEKATDYEYLILDLTDSMSGVLEVLEYCDRIYTLVRDDAVSSAKLTQYEQWMVEHSRADIVGKTLKFKLPEMTDIPTRPDMLTHSELAGYVRAVINDDVYGSEN